MTTLTPRPPYTREELDRLYPPTLELKLVQVLLRHGERSPVSARFQNAGLRPYWPYCNAARRMRSAILTPGEPSTWNAMDWQRQLEQFGDHDSPVAAEGGGGKTEGICQFGELTDTGRQSTYALGTRLRHLYVDQLQFMPAVLADSQSLYLRATPLPRALESVQQTFWGMYPLTSRTATFPPPTIVTRSPADETLYPNEGNCRRFAQLARAFGSRAADRYNASSDMDYINSKIGKWMPPSSPRVAVNSHPRLSGVLDTMNSTRAHGPETRLPREFYDEKVVQAMDRIVTEEWFAGYMENEEYRTLGIGALAGDVVERMTRAAGRADQPDSDKPGTGIKLALSGCHDTTIAGMLSALGTFDGQDWPPYTSHVAFELFHRPSTTNPQSETAPAKSLTTSTRPGWVASLFSSLTSSTSRAASRAAAPRQPYTAMSTTQKAQLQDHFVRVRYNDRVMSIPACRQDGNHLDGDETLCTLEAFKRVVDDFTPQDWKAQCASNMGGGIVGVDRPGTQVAGFYRA